MGDWQQATDVLVSASQERGGRGGNIEVALESVAVSVTSFITDWKGGVTKFCDVSNSVVQKIVEKIEQFTYSTVQW